MPLKGQNLFQATVSDFRPAVSGSTLTIEAGRCAGVKKPTVTATITGGSGNGSFVAYCTETQTIVVEYASSSDLRVQCSGCVTLQVTQPAVPEGMYRIASGAIAGGAFTSVTDERDFTGPTRHTNGLGMNVQCSSGNCVHQVDPAIVQLRSENFTPLAQLDAAKATMTRPFRMAAALSATCNPGEFLYLSSGAAGKRLHECGAANKWTPIAVAPVVARMFFGLAAMNGCESALPAGVTPADLLTKTALPAAAEEAALQCAGSGAGLLAKSIPSRSVTTVAPPNWTGVMENRVFAVDTAQGSPSGNWKLQLALSCSGNGDTYNPEKLTPLWSGVVRDSGQGRVAVSDAKGTAGGCKAGDLVTVHVRRLGGDADDTSAAPLKLLGIELGFVTE